LTKLLLLPYTTIYNYPINNLIFLPYLHGYVLPHAGTAHSGKTRNKYQHSIYTLFSTAVIHKKLIYDL
jgi:hypothetical protein